MAVSEQDRHRLFNRLEEVLGPEAATLIDYLPPVGWADVARRGDLDGLASGLRAEMAVTRAELRGEISELRGEMGTLRSDLRGEMAELRGEMGTLRSDLRGEMAELRGDLRAELERGIRLQTWRLVTTMTAMFGGMAALVAVVH
jgi:hypothetical protein